jgi:serine/threonine-protein kinase
VKVLPAHLASDSRLRERFDREGRAIAALSHPHICAIYDFGDASNPESQVPNPDTVSYLVMELLEGETLDRRIHGQPMPPADVVDLAADRSRPRRRTPKASCTGTSSRATSS